MNEFDIISIPEVGLLSDENRLRLYTAFFFFTLLFYNQWHIHIFYFC